MLKKLFLLFGIVLLLSTKSNAQRYFNHVYRHEIGVNIGVSNFNSDFAPKSILFGSTTINGLSIEATHYLQLVQQNYRPNSLLRKLILKTNLGVNFSSFNNNSYDTKNAKLQDPPRYTYATTPNKVLLGKLTSKTTIISLESELQYYLKDMARFLNKRIRHRYKNSTNPFVAVGFGIHSVQATPEYNPGQEAFTNNAGGNNGYPDNYNSSFFKETNDAVISTHLGFGARHKLESNFDLIAQMNVKYYFSDWIDGVNPMLEGNRSNDFNSTISVGLIYSLY
ncbi:MAG: hypothetical protein ACN4EF_00575 [Wenyingzhuangia sp.]|jgi:hypothetical protein|uniref:hypothetical protein n=1 Tax=Wenyingzhuangia sp. TaxID=1964193 RepID=UPI00321B8337